MAKAKSNNFKDLMMKVPSGSAPGKKAHRSMKRSAKRSKRY